MIRSIYFLLIILLVFSCNSSTSTKEKVLAGNWLIVYPDHALMDTGQLRLYGNIQDSLVRKYGLRLVQMNEDGSYNEPDSFFTAPGKWLLFEDRQLVIKGNSKDFELFIATFRSYTNNHLVLQSNYAYLKDSLPILWTLKKIKSSDPASELFEEDANEWRKKPTSAESDASIRDRVKAMLHYYAIYYNLVGGEAIYFSPARVPLPFKYFVRGIGFDKFNAQSPFASFFYDAADAKKAHGLINAARVATKAAYPAKQNYVLEYAAYFEILAKHIN